MRFAWGRSRPQAECASGSCVFPKRRTQCRCKHREPEGGEGNEVKHHPGRGGLPMPCGVMWGRQKDHEVSGQCKPDPDSPARDETPWRATPGANGRHEARSDQHTPGLQVDEDVRCQSARERPTGIERRMTEARQECSEVLRATEEVIHRSADALP